MISLVYVVLISLFVCLLSYPWLLLELIVGFETNPSESASKYLDDEMPRNSQCKVPLQDKIVCSDWTNASDGELAKLELV